VRNKISSSKLACLCAAVALLLLGCAGTVSERGADDEFSISDDEFVKSIKQEIDYEVTEKDAMEYIDDVRGKVVKWIGNVYEMKENEIQIVGPGEERRYNFFVFRLDHPLPKETRIGDMIQTISGGEAVCVIGRIMDLEDIVLRTQFKVSAPILRGYVISKDNDRDFKNPVWVRHKM